VRFAAGLAGIGLSAGFVAFMERAAVKSASKIDEKVVFKKLLRFRLQSIVKISFSLFSSASLIQFFKFSS
jgi:hypothetical protein